MKAMKVPKEFVFGGVVELVSRVVPPGPPVRDGGKDTCTGCYFRVNGIDCVDMLHLRAEQIPDCTEFDPGWTGKLKNYIFVKKETA